MGVVYRALDQKLGRPVALKVLPQRAINDPRRRERFLREARAAAAVHHGGIATVYEVGVDGDGTVYIAMELVHGRTLGAIVREDGPLSKAGALEILIAIAEALAHAHDKGVIHRDLKDENVMRTDDGVIKLLDFGIAKQFDVEKTTSGLEETEEAFTVLGNPMGTPGYMSPEQARGDSVDPRADIFSFGVLLVKLVTGALPFEGKSRVELTAAPLQQDPDLSKVPSELHAIAERCLQRHVSDRFEDAHALLAALHEAAKVPADDAPPADRRGGWVALAVAATIAAGGVAYWVGRAPSAPSATTATAMTSGAPTVSETQTDAAALRHRAVTTESAEFGAIYGAISPKGDAVAFGHAGGLFVRDIATGQQRRLADNEKGELEPIEWLEAQQKIICVNHGESPGLWTVDLSSGKREALYAPAFMAAVAPDGKTLAIAAEDGLRLLDIEGAQDQLIVPLPRRQAHELGMRFSADGGRLLFMYPVEEDGRQTGRVQSIALPDGEPETAFEDMALVGQTPYRTAIWLPDGRLVVAITEPPPNNRGSNLWETRVDPSTGQASGPLTRLTSWPSAGLWYASSSRDGTRVTFTMLKSSISIMVGELTDTRDSLKGEPKPLPSDGSTHWPSAWQDETTLIYTSDRAGRLDVFAHPVNANEPKTLLGTPHHDTYAAQRDDGSLLHFRIAWDEKASGVQSELMLTTGTAHRSLLRAPVETARFTFGSASPIGAGFRCTPDFETCVIGESRGGRFVISELDLEEGKGAQLAQVAHGGGLVSWDISPDGQRIALLEARLEHATSRMRVFNRGRGHTDVDLDRSCSPTGLDWPLADELFITCYDVSGHLLLRMTSDGQTSVLHRAASLSELWQPTVSPDAKRIMYRQDVMSSSIWLVEGW